uniref:Cytochrome c oxidase assembly protein COX20, mitochondrial n=1 Tax=Mesocestoides corti TaxID=53468 RepID=A0A5K3FIM6_MESCO
SSHFFPKVRLAGVGVGICSRSGGASHASTDPSPPPSSSDIPPSRLEETREPTSLESIPRILCGALSLPTFSVFFGRLLFSRIQSRIGQTVAGGIFYVGFTGLVSIYHKEMKFLRKCRRRVVEYTPE